MKRVYVGLLLGFALVGAPLAARAQGVGGNDERTYGTASLVSHTLQAFAFNGFTAADSAVFSANGAGSRYCTGPGTQVAADRCFFEAAVVLPAGALVTSIQLEACSDLDLNHVSARLFRMMQLEGAGTKLVEVVTPFGATGCMQTTGNLAVPHIIDNVHNTYFVEVGLGGAVALDVRTRFQAVRVFYRQQVSPAPASATFDDVPTTHPFFPFIEALVAAGITTGCSTTPPQYCPDGFVTRKQMAAFFARALGLHWAP
jgi:hypothetical protein